MFMLLTIFGSMVQQIMPHFVTQRALYEARERPSKAYSWQAFIISNIVVELPWNSLMAVITFFCFYYPIGMQHNATYTDAVHERGFLMFLLIWTFYLFTSTFTNMVIAGVETAENGGNIAQLAFSLTLIFCGCVTIPCLHPIFATNKYPVFSLHLKPSQASGFLCTVSVHSPTSSALSYPLGSLMPLSTVRPMRSSTSTRPLLRHAVPTSLLTSTCLVGKCSIRVRGKDVSFVPLPTQIHS
jgi:hypothetical protein